MARLPYIIFETIGEGTNTLAVNYQSASPGVQYSTDGINWSQLPYLISDNDLSSIKAAAQAKLGTLTLSGESEAELQRAEQSAYRTILAKEISGAQLTAAPNAAVTFGNGVKLYVRGKVGVITIADSDFSFVLGNDAVKVKVSGNIMGLYDWENPDSETLTKDCLMYKFAGCRALQDAGDLLLPATTLCPQCYRGMFSSCTSLIKAPKLPATTMEFLCYESMFLGCESLTTAPNLPAKTLANDCYMDMFAVCTSLTEAPKLPATTLKTGCYLGMFRGCPKLSKLVCLLTTLNDMDLEEMLGGSSGGVLYCAPGLKSAWEAMPEYVLPSGWTVREYVNPLVSLPNLARFRSRLSQSLGADIEALKAGKQDKTDNSLTTTKKTIAGAINEVNGKIPVIDTYSYTMSSASYTVSIPSNATILNIEVSKADGSGWGKVLVTDGVEISIIGNQVTFLASDASILPLDIEITFLRK